MAKLYVPIFFDWTDTTADLDQQQKGNLIDAVVAYASGRKDFDQIISELTAIERVAFRFMKGQVDRNDEISAARAKAGSKTKQMETNENKPEQKTSKANKLEQTETAGSKKFVKPTVEQVAEYCTERQNGLDPQHFVDFYESKGWRVGNQPMKDWKACVRTWESMRREGNRGESGRANCTNTAESRTDYSFLRE